MSVELVSLLKQFSGQYAPVVPQQASGRFHLLDLSDSNEDLRDVDVTSPQSLGSMIHRQVVDDRCQLAVGGYGEDRSVYRSDLFESDGEARSVHLGVDLWVPQGTPVSAPLDGVVHSMQNNNGNLDYGPTIILEHELEDMTFYTLYGHLAAYTLFQLEEGHPVPMSVPFTVVGDDTENGGWPPHLHFQIISDMGDFWGDFPGVARPSEADLWLKRCPDPNLILSMDVLKPE